MLQVWLALLIPIIAVFYLLFYHRQKVQVWEIFVVILLPFLLTVFVKCVAQASLDTSKEYWNDYAVQARHFEDWDEYIHATCPMTTCTGSGEDTVCTTSYYDCSYTSYHPASWDVLLRSGDVVGITSERFAYLTGFWKNKQFKDMQRAYENNDGDMFFSDWPGSLGTVEPFASMHLYRNKIKNTDNVLNFKKVDPKKEKVYEYPQVRSYAVDYILGGGTQEDQDYLRKWNAYLGARKKVVIMVALFKGRPIADAVTQAAYWKGGNKNEFVVCLGLDKEDKINWAYVISWTPKTVMKAKVEREIVEMGKVSLHDLIEYVAKVIDAEPGVIRRDFEEFNYITVPVPLWGIILIWLSSVVSTFGLAFWVVTNDFSCDEDMSDDVDYGHKRFYTKKRKRGR